MISRSSSTVVSVVAGSGAGWTGVGAVRGTSGGMYAGIAAVAA